MRRKLKAASLSEYSIVTTGFRALAQTDMYSFVDFCQEACLFPDKHLRRTVRELQPGHSAIDDCNVTTARESLHFPIQTSHLPTLDCST